MSAHAQHHPVTTGPGVDRRRFLSAAVTGAAALGLAGCAGFSRSDSGSSGGSTGSATGELTFVNWAGARGDAEFDAYQRIIDRFQAANPGTKVTQRAVPYAQVSTIIDSQLQAGTPPDLFRVSYIDIGLYTAKNVLHDLSSTFSEAEVAEFTPALWEAVKYDGKPYGVPQQTDTTAVLYRLDAFAAAGITNVPSSVDEAWTWDEFAAAATKLKGTVRANQYPFVYDWQSAGAYRWLTWLYEAGGSLFDADRKNPAIDSDAGRRALDFTKSFFTNGWVPRNTSVKSTTFPDSLFSSGTVAMAFAGDFLLPGIETDSKGAFKYGVMPQPRDVEASSDLGGNAVVATKDGKNPELAAKFLKFLVTPENMREFCAATIQLPTLKSLSGDAVRYAVRPDLMPTFVEQSTTIAPEQVAEVTVPQFGAINTVLQNELEAGLLGGRDTGATLAAISAGVAKAVAQ